MSTGNDQATAAQLSTTIAPVAATTGASRRDVSAPAEKKPMPRPEESAVAASSTTIDLPFHDSDLPANRSEANRRKVPTGKFRSTCDAHTGHEQHNDAIHGGVQQVLGI